MFTVCCATQAVRLHTICWARICEATGPPWPNPLQCGRMRSRGFQDVAQSENCQLMSALNSQLVFVVLSIVPVCGHAQRDLYCVVPRLV